MYTPFAHVFAYAIKQTPYAFVAKIILCMYLLYYVRIIRVSDFRFGRHVVSKERGVVFTLKWQALFVSLRRSVSTGYSIVELQL